MATTKQTPPQPPRVTLSPNRDGSLIAEYPWKLFRFLLDDGSTLDVHAIRDDSDLRGEVLKHVKGKGTRIEGVATVEAIAAVSRSLPELPPAKGEVSTKKRTVKRAS